MRILPPPLAVLALAALCAGCGGVEAPGPAGAPGEGAAPGARTFAYAISNDATPDNRDGAQLALHEIDPANGALLKIAGVPAGRNDDLEAGFGRFLYRAGPRDVAAYRIDPDTGRLTPIAEFPGFPNPTQLALAGRLLAMRTGSYTTGTYGGLTFYSVDEGTGALAWIGSATPRDPSAMAFHRPGAFLYVGAEADFDEPEGTVIRPVLETYRVPVSGVTEPIRSRRLVDGALRGRPAVVSSAVVDLSGRYLYVCRPPAIDVYGIDIGSATGDLTLLSSVPVDQSSLLAVEPSGRYLLSVSSIEMRAYFIGADGSLALAGAAASAGTPRAFVVDPAGGFAYVSIENPPEIRSFSIRDGSLLAYRGVVARGGGAMVLVRPRPS